MLCAHVKQLLQATRLFHGFWNRSSSNSRIDKNFHEFYFCCSFAIYYFYVFFYEIYTYIHFILVSFLPYSPSVSCSVQSLWLRCSFLPSLKYAKPRIERDLCSLWGFLRVGTGHCSMNVIESRVSVWCLLYQIFPTRSYSFFFVFAFWTTRYERKDAVDMSTSLTAWMQYAILRFSVKLLEHSCIKCLSQPPLSTVILHRFFRRAVKFPPVPINCMYPVLPSHFSVLSYCIGSFAESCIFSSSSTLHVRYFTPPPVSSVTSHWLALRVVYFPPVPIYCIYPVSTAWTTLTDVFRDFPQL